MRWSTVAGFLVAGALAMLVGCATAPEQELGDPLSRPPPLRVAATLQFHDLPVPMGCQYQPTDSFSAQGTGYRVGQFVYKGSGDPFNLIRFFEEQMPSNGWEKVRDLDVGSRVVLFFNKLEERCIVVIHRGKKPTVKITLY